jgi:hypothetical protein
MDMQRSTTPERAISTSRRSSTMADTRTQRDGRVDFDFLIGQWKVHHRLLRKRPEGSTTWEQFGGTAVVRKVLGGLGNIDEISMERVSGRLYGMTVRLYDPLSQQWSIYWADNVHGGLQPPTIGAFADGRGVFFSHEPFEGKHIFVRYIWSTISDNSCSWEQAYSADGGQTWEINWIMEFSRQP